MFGTEYGALYMNEWVGQYATDLVVYLNDCSFFSIVEI